MTYAELDAAVDRVARGMLALGIERGDRVGIWAPNCAEWVLVQYATAKLGAILVNVNPAYRTHELAYVLDQSGTRLLVAARGVQDQRLPRDGRGGARRARRAGARRLHRLAGLGRAARRRRGRRPRRAARARGDARLRRPDQPPVHERHDGLPQGRDALAPQHPQQRLLRRRADRVLGGRPHLHPGALLPLLRHGHGQPRGDEPRRVHGHPRARLRSRRDAARRRRRALHLALRRADDVHRDARLRDVRDGRARLAAHRHHGRLPVPGRGHAARHRRDAHERGEHLLRHDRDLAGVDADAPRRLARAPRRLGRPRRSARRGQGRRSRDAASCSRTASRASCAPAATR